MASTSREPDTRPPKGSTAEGDEVYPALDEKMISLTLEDGTVKQIRALNKRFVPNFKYIRFFMPSLEALTTDTGLIEDWKEHMQILRDDLKWLLKLPHHKFWSVFVYSHEVSDDVLTSFLIRAPRFFDFEFKELLNHYIIGPLYKEIYFLVFRIFMRLSTFKESKEDHITPKKWSCLIFENYFFDIPKMIDLCCLYESKDNHLLPKMLENVFKHEPRFIEQVDLVIKVLIMNAEDQLKQLNSKVKENQFTSEWNLKEFQELIVFSADQVVSLYKFLKVYPPAAEWFHRYEGFEIHLASVYEKKMKLWIRVVEHLPSLEVQVDVWRLYLIRLFRTVLCTPTILSIDSSSSSFHTRIDEFFHVMTSCLDENLFIHDYEKTHPFRFDMQTLLSKGVYVDETRVEYLANAIEACFEACGTKYSVEKKVTDPLYDPTFDLQLLGACSADVVGVELDSLVTQVKDLLPDLPRPYVEACLKHYGYNAEAVINAMLEQSIPAHLEKFKDANFAASQTLVQSSYRREDPVKDELPVAVAMPNAWGSREETEFLGLSFTKGKRRFRDDATFFNEGKELKQRILESIQNDDAASKPKSSEGSYDPYLDESYLPDFDQAIEYNDEYDDTYDEAGVGMIEPDAQVYKPLNLKADELRGNGDGPEEEYPGHAKPEVDYQNFVADPAIIRAQMERRREEKFHHSRGRSQQAVPPSRDVVGKAKGQGQDKDVLLARRHKDQAGNQNRRKRADFKRKEF